MLRMTYNEKECFFVGDDLYIRVGLKDDIDTGCMVGLQMVYQQVVQGPPVKDVLKIFKQLAAACPVNRIEENGLLVKKHIGIVAYTTRNRKAVFEQCKPMVIGSHPEKVIRHFSDIIHTVSFLYLSR